MSEQEILEIQESENKKSQELLELIMQFCTEHKRRFNPVILQAVSPMGITTVDVQVRVLNNVRFEQPKPSPIIGVNGKVITPN